MRRRPKALFLSFATVLAFPFLAEPASLRGQTPVPIPANHVRIHYFRPDGNYLGWTVYAGKSRAPATAGGHCGIARCVPRIPADARQLRTAQHAHAGGGSIEPALLERWAEPNPRADRDEA